MRMAAALACAAFDGGVFRDANGVFAELWLTHMKAVGLSQFALPTELFPGILARLLSELLMEN